MTGRAEVMLGHWAGLGAVGDGRRGDEYFGAAYCVFWSYFLEGGGYDFGFEKPVLSDLVPEDLSVSSAEQ